MTLGLEKLNENGTVTFIGPDGCGKTWHGLELLNKASKRKVSVSYTILRLSSIENWEEVLKQYENLIVFYDDIFRTRGTSVASLRRKLNSLENIWKQMQDNNLKVIVSINSAIFYRYRDEFEECRLFKSENIVEIVEESPEEKLKILKVYFRHFDIAMVENEQHENICSKTIFEANLQLKICKKTMAMIAKTDTSIGFFQCCELFIQNRAFAHYGLEFFKDPTFFLDEELNTLALSDSAGTLRHSTKHDVLKIPRNVKWRHYDVITMTPYYYRYRLLIARIGSNFRLNLFYVLTTTTFCCVYQNNYVYQFWSKITAR